MLMGPSIAIAEPDDSREERKRELGEAGFKDVR
jgi:hypothetical protein